MNNFEDQLEIRALLERYCDGVNQRDAEIWGGTWANDAVWELPHLDMAGISGRDNIVAAWLEAMQQWHSLRMAKNTYGALGLQQEMSYWLRRPDAQHGKIWSRPITMAKGCILDCGTTQTRKAKIQ